MRVGYLDCFAGISGDMLLGALVDAGVPLGVLEDATAALGLGASLRVDQVDRSGIACTKVHVMEGTALADGGLDEQDAAPSYTLQPQTRHLHREGHIHEPEAHGRSLTEIRDLIQSARLESPVKRMATHAFELLGASEAKIHGLPIDDIHFHEVGAVDAIVDIVAGCAGLHHLAVVKWFCSPLNVGGGMVTCAHGTFPVPAPATADLLRGVPTYSAHVQKELVTPTGAALVRALEPEFGPQPAMRVEAIGYGAGTRNPANFPNVLRLSVGETTEGVSDSGSRHQSDHVVVLETALDDLSPQVIAYFTEKALAVGALDVMQTPVIMKKGRSGILLTVLCDPDLRSQMERLMLRETSTLGVRMRKEHRTCLERSHVTVSTEFGDIRVKVGSLGGEELNIAPEFEDCRAVAERAGVALKTVQHAAIAAYRTKA